jgi:ER lumen protein retaining receptor
MGLAEFWSFYRCSADLTHLLGTGILLSYLLLNRHCRGLSWKTQLLFTVTFCARYLDLPRNIEDWHKTHNVEFLYLSVFKFWYIGSQVFTMLMFWRFNRNNPGTNYEEHKDSVNVWMLLVPCAVFAVFAADTCGVRDLLWAYSEYLEGFALVPQYVFIYRHNFQKEKRERNAPVDAYTLCMGGYRFLYVLNWIHKKSHGMYVHKHCLYWGIIESAFFFDFLVYLSASKSFLQQATLGVDDAINSTSDSIELKVFPERVTYIDARNTLRYKGSGGNTLKGKMLASLDEEGDMAGETMIGSVEHMV